MSKLTTNIKEKIKQSSSENKIRLTKAKSLLLKHKLFLFFLLSLLIFLIINYFQEGFMFALFRGDAVSLQESIERFGSFALVAYFFLIILEVVFAPIPSILLYSLGGVLFGGFLATLVTFLGNAVGAGIAFYISKVFLKDRFDIKISEKSRKTFNKSVEKHGHYAVFFLRLNPFTSSDAISYLAGLTSMKFIPFIISTSLGLLPLIFIQTYIGGEFLSSHPFLVNLLFILTGIFLLVGFVSLFALFKKK